MSRTLSQGALVALLCALLGCAPGVQWRGYIYEPVYSDARRDQKITLAYFRHWSVVACTDFEEKVLKNPAVLAATRAFYCVALDILIDDELATSWSVREPPGVVLIAPDGRVLETLTGRITADQLLMALTRARSVAASSSAPATP